MFVQFVALRYVHYVGATFRSPQFGSDKFLLPFYGLSSEKTTKAVVVAALQIDFQYEMQKQTSRIPRLSSCNSPIFEKKWRLFAICTSSLQSSRDSEIEFFIVVVVLVVVAILHKRDDLKWLHASCHIFRS